MLLRSVLKRIIRQWQKVSAFSSIVGAMPLLRRGVCDAYASRERAAVASVARR